MPNIKSAKKELRKGAKKHERNLIVKKNLKDLIKKSRKMIAAAATEAPASVAQTLKALDKAAQKGIIKKNTANRKKSRLHKRLNKTTSSK